jgi:CDP-diacylglycerol--glycerol-3-phosphate 3-phosphatidyltransferase
MTRQTLPPPTANLSNLLTVIRIILAVVVIVLLPRPGLGMQLLAGAIFAIAALTDLYDGKLARKYNWITNFGKIVDPIADKLLTLGAFTTLSLIGMFPLWILIPIFLREVLITILRFWFLSMGVAVAAEKSGKLKTTLQIAAIAVTWLNLLFRDHLAAGLPAALTTLMNVVMYVVLLAALYQTLVSGYDFLRNNWHLIRAR